MALSEHEKKMLEELERTLYEDDAKFVQRVATGRPSSSTRVVGGSITVVIGVSVLIFAAVTQQQILGAVGFVLMLAGLVLATSGQTAEPGERPRKSASSPKPEKPSGGSFFEDRWNNRS
jgi:hypothetical protein